MAACGDGGDEWKVALETALEGTFEGATADEPPDRNAFKVPAASLSTQHLTQRTNPWIVNLPASGWGRTKSSATQTGVDMALPLWLASPDQHVVTRQPSGLDRGACQCNAPRRLVLWLLALHFIGEIRAGSSSTSLPPRSGAGPQLVAPAPLLLSYRFMAWRQRCSAPRLSKRTRHPRECRMETSLLWSWHSLRGRTKAQVVIVEDYTNLVPDLVACNGNFAKLKSRRSSTGIWEAALWSRSWTPHSLGEGVMSVAVRRHGSPQELILCVVCWH